MQMLELQQRKVNPPLMLARYQAHLVVTQAIAIIPEVMDPDVDQPNIIKRELSSG